MCNTVCKGWRNGWCSSWELNLPKMMKLLWWNRASPCCREGLKDCLQLNRSGQTPPLEEKQNALESSHRSIKGIHIPYKSAQQWPFWPSKNPPKQEVIDVFFQSLNRNSPPSMNPPNRSNLRQLQFLHGKRIHIATEGHLSTASCFVGSQKIGGIGEIHPICNIPSKHWMGPSQRTPN